MVRRTQRVPVPNKKYIDDYDKPQINKGKKKVQTNIKTKKIEKKEKQKVILEKKKKKIIEKKQNKKQEGDDANIIYNTTQAKQQKLEELYIPKDDLTEQINKSLIKLKVYFKNTKVDFPNSLINGVHLLDVKPEDYKEPKKVLWSKFIKGEYHTKDSNSDIKGIAPKIKTIINQLPSFKVYKDEEDMTWIIIKHRLLFYEIVEHVVNNKLAPSTFKGFINVMMRIIRLGYNSKNTPIYIKYSIIQDDISVSIKSKETEQQLNDHEKTKYLEWKYVMLERNKLENEFNLIKNKVLSKNEAFKTNLDLILASLYTLTPVLRREIASLCFTDKKPKDKKGNYVYFNSNGRISLELYETKKKHGYISIPLNYREENDPSGISLFLLKNQQHLAILLQESFKLYPRKNIFVNVVQYNKGKEVAVTIASVANRLNKIYKKYSVNIGASALRSSFITYLNNLYIKKTGNVLTSKEKDEIAEKFMRTSRQQLDDAYNKIFRNSNVFEIPLDAILFDDDGNLIEKVNDIEHNDFENNNDDDDDDDDDIGYDREEHITKPIIPVYDRQLERVNKAYKESKQITIVDDNGKEKVTTEAREQKRLYYHKRDKFLLARQRILREYHGSKKRNITKQTIEKYKFTEEELERDDE